MGVHNQIKLDRESGHTMAMFGSTLASSQIIESVGVKSILKCWVIFK